MPIPNLSGASWPSQAEPDSVDFEIISAAANAYGVVSGCACTPASSGSTLGVAVASGSVHVGSSTPVSVTGATVTPGAANGTNPRFDLITVDNTGALAVVAGTAATAPEYPAIPASRTVLAAVYIPAAATSITAVNIVDKRQMVNRTPQFGTTNSTAARGDHLHSGEYASTLHADTHGAGGSDALVNLGGVEITPMDGTGTIQFGGNTAVLQAPDDDSHIRIGARWWGYRPVLVVRSLDREMAFGDETCGPMHVWRVYPAGSAAAPATSASHVASTNTAATWSAPTWSASLGLRQPMATSSTSGNAAFVSTTLAPYVRGDSALPWQGYWLHFMCIFEHANGYTSTNFFCGFTDQAATTALSATANFAGHRHGFRIANGSGNFQMTTKDGTTEHLMDTGMAFATNAVFEFSVFIRPGGGYPFGMVQNLTAGTSTGSLIDVSANVPGATTGMRAVCGIATTTTAVRGLSLVRAGAQVSV